MIGSGVRLVYMGRLSVGLGRVAFMNIEDLKKSVSEMTDEELMALVLETRKSRHTSKRVEKAVKVEEKKAGNEVDRLLKNLSQGDMAALLKSLRGA